MALYADYYFEYDNTQSVRKEIINGGSRTYTFDYFRNPSFTNNDYSNLNVWERKVVETLPDGTQNFVFTNSAGQTMLTVLKSGSDEWYRFSSFDANGRAILRASSEALSGYDESYGDLLNYNSGTGKYQYLKDNTGLITKIKFYETTGSGAAEGYFKSRSVQEGQNGTPIKLEEWEYTSHSAGDKTVYPVSKKTVYRNTDGTGELDDSLDEDDPDDSLEFEAAESLDAEDVGLSLDEVGVWLLDDVGISLLDDCGSERGSWRMSTVQIRMSKKRV